MHQTSLRESVLVSALLKSVKISFFQKNEKQIDVLILVGKQCQYFVNTDCLTISLAIDFEILFFSINIASVSKVQYI